MIAGLKTRLTAEYGLEHPITQAPMAFVGTAPDLAIAVCQTGGMGSLAVGPLPASALRSLIQAVRRTTTRPLNVNFITFLTKPEQIQVCVEEGVRVVSFHWGHPRIDYVDRLHAAGIKIWEQVGSVDAAREAVDRGADALIAQGSEAGGHNYGMLPLFVLVPNIIEAVSPIPVLAAGGISTGRQVAAALTLGADAVCVGTRLVASKEAFAHAAYKRHLVEASSDQTLLTSIYGPEMPQFNPMRVLDSGLAREFAGREDQAPKDIATQPIIARMTLGAEEVSLRRFTSFVPTPSTAGEIEQLPFLAGQGVGLVHDILPVKQIIEGMVAEAITALSSFDQG